MREYLKFYIDGQWVDPLRPNAFDVENPATEQVSGKISLGSAADVDVAVKAARRAFAGWSQTTREQRLDLLQAILAEYQKRADDLAEAITEEIGAPLSLAAGPQVFLGIGHLTTAIDALKNFPFEEQKGASLIAKEPIGVCGLITPWNWPINQVAVKVYPALATGCTVILKPSEVAPYSPYIFAEILDAAGVPAGVFNLVNGDGAGVGVALASHPDIDMVSFTGSTRAGIEVAKLAAPTVKRVTQELGGKSPNIVLDDSGFAQGVSAGVANMMPNSGQSCNAPTRMLVPNSRMGEAISIAREAAEKVTVGHPDAGTTIGPVASKTQFDKVQRLIQQWGKDQVVNVGQRASLYRTMERLQSEGLIAVRETSRDQAYPERTVYQLTDEGRAAVRDWLTEMLAAPRSGRQGSASGIICFAVGRVFNPNPILTASCTARSPAGQASPWPRQNNRYTSAVHGPMPCSEIRV